jgi:RNA polymerase sigma-70 factor (ECF subfamily)
VPTPISKPASPQLNLAPPDRSNSVGKAAIDDAELVRRFKHGDEDSFDELVRRYRPRIYALSYRFVRNSEDADEIAQDAFVRAYRALPRFREKSSFYTWLYRIAVNLAYNRLRTRGRDRVQAISETNLDEDTVEDLPGHDEPGRDFRQSELRAAIRKAVDELPKRQRAVFILRQYEGFKNEEVARTLHCSVGAVKAHHFFAIQKLQNALKDWKDEMSKD